MKFSFKKPVAKLAISLMVASIASTSLYQQAYAVGNSSGAISADSTSYMLNDITMAKDLNLEFGETYAGDADLTITANSTVTGSGQTRRQAAKFTVTGEAGHTFSYSLPGTFNMTATPDVDATTRIEVNTFTVSDASPQTLSGAAGGGATGTKVLYLGATRAAPVASQVVGAYSGSFTFTVAYP